MSDSDFDIVPIQQVPLEAVLNALNRATHPGHSCDWFVWKHEVNPAGTSLGWVALGKTGVLGIRLFMHWKLQVGTALIHAVRPVDTVTVPEARRQGVFRKLTEFAVAAVVANPQIDLIFNTPNENSRPGYARMGWTILPPLAHALQPSFYGRYGTIVQDDFVFDAFDSADLSPTCWMTQSSANFMRWRYDSRSGVDYRWARLSAATTPNGVIYRVTTKWGIRLLVINELTGSTNDCSVLLHSVARKEHTPALLLATGSGARNIIQGPRLRRGNSVVAVRPLRAHSPDPTRLESWALTLGDLEQVI